MNMMMGESPSSSSPFFATPTTATTPSPSASSSVSLLPADRLQSPAAAALTTSPIAGNNSGTAASDHRAGGNVSATLSNAAAILSKMSSAAAAAGSSNGGHHHYNNKNTTTTNISSPGSSSSSLKTDAILLPIWNMIVPQSQQQLQSDASSSPLPSLSLSIPSLSSSSMQFPAATAVAAAPLPPPSSVSPFISSLSSNSSSSSSLSSSTSSLPSVLSLSGGGGGGGSSDHLSNSASNSIIINNNITSSGSSMDIYTCQISCPARVVLTPLPHSHMFEERAVDAGSPIKIGRAVARFKPCHNNAIFDCKVLSRNHALLWYESGRFLIQDTKSSNGTFVNNRRLSVANEESEPVEITSGDVVQFGVDVVENQKRVTHGCISASIRLFLPGGEEVPVPESHANASLISSLDGLMVTSTGSTSDPKSIAPAVISSSQLLQLTHCLRDALNREDFLQKKIHLLEQVVDRTRESAESGWRSMMQEDALLSKIESLQTKLESVLKSLAAKTADEETCNLRQEVQSLHSEREEYEHKAKESILSHKSRVREAEENVHKMRIEVDSLIQEKENLMSQVEKMDSELTSMSEAYDRCREELVESLAKVKSEEEEIARLTRDPNEDAIDVLFRERKEKEYEATKVKLADAIAGITKLEGIVRDLEQEKEGLLVQITSSANAEDEDDKGEKDDEIERLTTTVEELMNSLNDAIQQYEQKREEYQQIWSQHESCSILINKLRHQIVSLSQHQGKGSSSEDGSADSFNSQQSSTSLPLGSSASYSEIMGDQTDHLGGADAHLRTRSTTTTTKEEAAVMSGQQQQQEISCLKDEIRELRSSHEDQVKQLKSYIKCLESDLQESRVQMVIHRSMSPAVGSAADVLTAPSTSHEPLQDNGRQKEQELEEKLTESILQRDILEEQVKCMKEEMENIRSQSFYASICAIGPLIILVIAILTAFYPIVSMITGTTE